MKKIALAAVLAGVSSMASANLLNTDNLYVQGNVGYSKLGTKVNGSRATDNAPSFAVAVGKDAGDLRYAVDYAYLGKIEDKSSRANVEFTAQSLGFSVIYDFQPVSGFTPYVGGRLSANRLATEVSASSSYFKESKTNLGAGALAGVQYSINPQLAVDAGVEYNYLGKAVNDRLKFDQYGAKLGLRYNF